MRLAPLRGIYLLVLLVSAHNLHSYGEPAVNLGLTNLLDGGPLRPEPGFYWVEFLQYYQTHKFLDARGCPLDGVLSPKLKEWALISQFFYQFPLDMLKSNPGISFVIPALVGSHISESGLGHAEHKSGVGDVLLGLFLQGKYFNTGDRPLFIQRFEFDVSFPTGKFRPAVLENAGNGFYFLTGYWAATLFFTEHIAASWRLNYVWNTTNKKTCVKAGDAIFGNFDIEVEPVHNLWVGMNGYFFNQLFDNKLRGVKVPESKASVIGLGPGVLYSFPKGFDFFANLYFEMKARNRTEGWRFILRLFKQF